MSSGKYAFFGEKISVPKIKTLLMITVGLLSVYLSYNPLFHGDSWWGHDYSAHLNRVHTTLASLNQGQFPPYFDVDYKDYPGYSWNLFYPPLYNLIGTAIQYATADYNVTVLLVCLSIFLIAFYCAFCLFRLNNRLASRAVFLALCYACSLYLVDNLFIRSAFPESLALAFFPLLIAGLIAENQKHSLNYLVIANSLILLSNIPASLSTLLFLGLYFTFHHRQIDKIKLFIKAYSVALLLSAWFVFPLVYAMYQSALVMSESDFYTLMGVYSVDLYHFISGDLIKSEPLKHMVLGLGYPLSVVFVYSLWGRKSAVEKNHLIIFVLIFFITTSVNYSFLPDILSLFAKIQFSWRLTPFVVLLVLLEISRNDKIGVNVIASMLLATALISTVMTITLYQTKKIDLNKTESFATVGYTDYVLADAVKYKDHLAPKHLLCNTGEKIHSVVYTKTIESNGLPLYTFNLPEAGECLIPFLAYNPLYLTNVSDYWRDGFFQATLPQGTHQVAVKLKPVFRYLLYATMLLSLATALLLYRHNRR